VNPALRASAAHVFVASLDDPTLASDDDHHLRRVLRIAAADRITVSDGRGGWVEARVVNDRVDVESPRFSELPPPPSSVVCAIPKGDRPEWIVQKLTEVGVMSIGFMHCARSVVRWDGDRAHRHIERLRRVAREAAMQSRRVWLPTVHDTVSYATAVAAPTCAVAEADSLDGVETMLIGPEGGFTAEELAAATRRVSLSDHILRVETAALTGAIMLTQSHHRD
jgi:16S rRNA (uracil1498-N3)-methyltransferase